jgi:hypothetical protein
MAIPLLKYCIVKKAIVITTCRELTKHPNASINFPFYDFESITGLNTGKITKQSTISSIIHCSGQMILLLLPSSYLLQLIGSAKPIP